MSEFLTLSEVAKLLRVNPKTVYRLVSKRKIPATLVGKRWRFNRDSIEDWLKSLSTEGSRAVILVVDDDEAIRLLFQSSLEDLGHRVTLCGTAEEALEYINKDKFDLVFIDLMLPGMDGAELLSKVRALKPGLPVTIITGYPESEVMARALSFGPFGVMKKPFVSNDILAAAANHHLL